MHEQAEIRDFMCFLPMCDGRAVLDAADSKAVVSRRGDSVIFGLSTHDGLDRFIPS
jgi:hypothetical protein